MKFSTLPSTVKLFLMLAVASPIYAAVIFVPAADWRWLEGWVFLTILMGYAFIQGAYTYEHDPGLAEERMRSKWPERGWDRAIISVLYPAMIAMLILPGLDHRNGWTDVAGWLQIVGLVATILGFVVTFFVMRENSFLSASVKIQAERGHEVITTGPYAVVRHPMYAGTFLYCLGIPLLLDSYYGLIPGLLSIVLLVVRTVLEDRTLHAELAGYPEYAAVTRYRLVPGLW